MLMQHPEYGTKDVSFEYQHKFIEHGWSIVKTKNGINEAFVSEKKDTTLKRGRPFKVG